MAAPAGRPDRFVAAHRLRRGKPRVAVEDEPIELSAGLTDRIVDIHPGSSPHRARGGPDAQVPDRSAAGAQLVHQRGDRSQPQIVFARLRVPGGVRAEKPHGVALGMRVPDVTVLVFGDRDFRDIQRSRQRESDRAAERPGGLLGRGGAPLDPFGPKARVLLQLE